MGNVVRLVRVIRPLAVVLLADDAQAAYDFLRDQGYRNVAVLEAGLAGWTRRGYRLER